MLGFQGYGYTDPGQKRDNNEDYFIIEKDLGLFVLCDGVGGENSGEKASYVCAHAICDYFKKHKTVLEQYQKKPSLSLRRAILDMIRESIQEANRLIHDAALPGSGMEGMATTVNVLIQLADFALVGHVGDSRTYLIRSGVVHQLTEDHNFGAEMIRKGEWTEAQSEQSPYSNTLTRAVGAHPAVQPDLLEVEVTHEDMFLMCSDGLSDYFSSEELQNLIRGQAVSDLPAFLAQQANAKGGKDNVTVVFCRVESRAAEKQIELNALDAVKKQQAMNKVPLFGYFSFAELSKVLAVTTARSIRASEFLFKEGEVGNEMYVVVSGGVKVLKGTHVLAELRQGAPIGEMSVIDNSPRSASIQATEPTTVLMISRNDIINLLKQEPRIGVKFLWAMGQELERRLRTTSRDLAEARSIIERTKEQALQDDLPFELEKI